MEDKLLKHRLLRFYMIILACVLVLVARLWHLQIVQGEHFARLADGNRMRRISVTPTRGIIYDRNGIELVRSRPAFTVSLVPGGIPQNGSETLELLSEILDLTVEELNTFIQRGRGFPYEPVRVLRDVDAGVVVAIEENRMRLPGVFIEEEAVREYLYGDLASHVIGYLGVISASELRELGPDYSGSDIVGKVGMERLFQEELRGTPGTLTVEVNALSRPIQTVSSVEPVPGSNLHLAIDRDLQKAAEEAFREHTAYLRAEGSSAESGTVIAMDPSSGHVLALVSEPGFEPSKLLDASERNAYYQSLLADPAMPFLNRSTQGQYGPGSAFKPFVGVAMLEERVVTPNQVFNATGTSRYGVRDWVITQRLAPFGEITLRDAIAMSSNHYFAEFGAKVGIDKLAPWLRDLGFGAPTGILSSFTEMPGLVPDREWKRVRFADQPRHEQVWYPTDTEQVAIGQGFMLVTPIQLAVAYSGIANRGRVPYPVLVTALVDPEGTVAREYVPSTLQHVEAADSTWTALIAGLEGAITHRRGTARNAFSGFPISVAGKTGSYQIPGKDSHALFAAFAPVQDPELVVVVIVEHGVGGGSGAAPIARKVFEAYFGVENSTDQEGIGQ